MRKGVNNMPSSVWITLIICCTLVAISIINKDKYNDDEK